MASPLIHETVWLDKYKYDDAEKKWQEQIAKTPKTENEKQISHSSLVGEIARARQHIKNSLQSGESVNLVLPTEAPNLNDRVQKLEAENEQLQKLYYDLQSLVQKLENRIVLLEGKPKPDQSMTPSSTPVKSPVKNKPEQDDDDDIDLFGSGESEDESSKIREQRLKEYADKKSKKKAVIAKSSVVLDVKPWDDETNMKEMEIKVREIEMDGLKWGASKLVPLAYGIHKLQIVCVVEDEKVSIDWLQETIEEIKDYVQSVDIAAFNKL